MGTDENSDSWILTIHEDGKQKEFVFPSEDALLSFVKGLESDGIVLGKLTPDDEFTANYYDNKPAKQ